MTSLQIEAKPNSKQVCLGPELFSFFSLITLSFLPMQFFFPHGLCLFHFSWHRTAFSCCEVFGGFCSLNTLITGYHHSVQQTDRMRVHSDNTSIYH